MTQLSKRERAALDFVALIQNRTKAALKKYFISHGVYVAVKDIEHALRLDEHQDLLNSLAREFDVTRKAIHLANDLGSISLSEKQKAMLALYEIENTCASREGNRGSDLTEADALLLARVRTWPASPSLIGLFVTGLVGCLCLYLKSFPFGVLLIVGPAIYGAFRLRNFERRKAQALAQIADANARFDTSVTTEITPRPGISSPNDNSRYEALVFAGIVAAITLAIVIFRFGETAPTAFSASNGSDVTTVASSGNQASPPQREGLQRDQRAAVEFDWMIGKYPYQVLSDRRFRAAFRNVSSNEWKRIADRIEVASGIVLQDGYYFGSGCKPHLCGSDDAAFVINKVTGRGDVIYHETDYSSNKSFVRSFTWPDTPATDTPLADWAKSEGIEIATGTPEAGSSTYGTLQTSFDCGDAHSDAERLICTDTELAADDVVLTNIFASAKAAATDQVAFKAFARRTWNYREQSCHDRNCLVRWYADQNVALRQIAESGNVPAG